MKEELTDFLRHCAVERRLAPLTCAAYERDVSACLGYLQGEGVGDLDEVRPTHLRGFLAEDAKRRPAPSSQARATAALKSFFRFLVDDEQLERDPARPLRTPKKREALPDVLTMAELERLLAAPDRGDIWERHFCGKRERDRLLLALFAYAGLRRSELLGLSWDDVDLSRRLLYVRKAKGGRQRVVPIHPALAPLFAAYYATRVPLVEQALFVGVQGKPLNYTQLGQVFRHYVASSGVGERKRVTPHTLRHVFASELLRAGANLRQVQELLGHKHLDSTQRYTRVTAHELRGAVKRLRWVGRLDAERHEFDLTEKRAPGVQEQPWCRSRVLDEMPIPDFQTLMRPLLELHANGAERTQGELRDALASQFELTEEDLAQRLPSGTARTFVNRVAWASTHMKEAGLLVKPRRGISTITERGRTVLRDYPDRVNMAVLEQFPEYIEFRTRSSGRRRVTQSQTQEQIPVSIETPEETIDAAYRQVRAALAEELRSRLVEHDDRFFEDVVLDVLLALGYGGSKPDAAERVGGRGDGGIDGVIREDTLGLDAIYVQAKKWAPERGIGPREIREFLGALQDVEATKGIFITTSSFSTEARELARRRRVVLIDGLELATHMVDTGVGVTTLQAYELKRIDEDYFTELE